MRRILPILMALAIAGCASNPKPFKLDDAGGQQRWQASDMIDVAVSDADRTRLDEHFGLFGKFPGTVETGPIWARIFIGNADSPKFTITSAKLQDETLAAGFAMRIHYVVDGVLTFNGREYPIHAEGARATGGIPWPAMHEAVQLGVVDAAHKVRAVVTGQINPQAVPAPQAGN